MANDFDMFPVYDDFIKKDSRRMSDVWSDVMATFYMNLIQYLSQGGIFIPTLTQDQINALEAPIAGQMVYNTTNNVPQIYQNGAWKTFTTT